MHKRTATRGLLALIAALALPHGLAQSNTSHNAQPSRPRRNTRKPPADKGPGETRTERDQRLQRECRGKPNAGACEGYAS